MSEYEWTQVRADAVAKFAGQVPDARLEAELIDFFEAFPATVVGEIDRVAQRFATGSIHSPWKILRLNVDNAGARHDVRASDANERQKAVRKLQAFVRNAGVYFDREDEVRAEVERLLGEFGSDRELVDGLIGDWVRVRPRGERAEAATLAYQQQCGAAYWVTRASRPDKDAASAATAEASVGVSA